MCLSPEGCQKTCFLPGKTLAPRLPRRVSHKEYFQGNEFPQSMGLQFFRDKNRERVGRALDKHKKTLSFRKIMPII